MIDNETTSDATDNYADRLTIKQAAHYLGTTVGVLYVWRCKHRHDIPWHIGHGRIYYLKHELDLIKPKLTHKAGRPKKVSA